MQPQSVRGGGESAGRLNLLSVLWARRGVLIAFIVVALAGAGIYLYQATPIYKSVSQVYIESQAPRIMSTDDMAMTMGLSAQVEIMKSTALLDAAVKLPAMQMASFMAEGQVNPIGYIKGGLDVIPAATGDMLFVGFSSPVPDDNAIVVNSVVEAYIDYHNLKRRSTAAEVLKILREEKDQLETEFDEKSQAMLQFKQDNDTLTFGDGSTNPELARLAKLSGELTDAELVLLDARTDHEAAQAVKASPEKLEALIRSARLAGDPVAMVAGSDPGMDQRIQELKHLLSMVAARQGSKHYRAIELQTEIDLLEQSQMLGADDGTQLYLDTLEARWRDAVNRRDALNTQYNQQQAVAMQQDVQATEFSMLVTAANRLDRQIDLIDSRIKELNVTEDTGVLTISILEPAVKNSTAVAPKKAQALAIAMVLGLMLGVGVAFGLDFMDDRIRSAEELTEYLGIPVLGLVPRLGKDAIDQAATIVQDQSKSPVSEAYRTIRTALHFGTLRTGGRTILVSSPQPGDGKSTVSSNLAIAFAQTGARTLILDADCRKPRQHKIHGLDRKVGLSSVLSESATLDEAIQSTGIESLDILPCGPLPTNPTEMLNTPLFEKLLSDLTSRYDRVIIDSPPVVAVADARVIGAMTDATLLVVKADSTRRKVVEAAMNALESVGARVVGAVVNSVTASRSGYGSYGRYGYYAYGYEASQSASGLLEAGSDADLKPSRAELSAASVSPEDSP